MADVCAREVYVQVEGWISWAGRLAENRHRGICVDGDIGEHAAHEQIGRYMTTANAPRKAFARGLKSRLNFESYFRL